MGVIISKAARKKIAAIFEHPGNIYSIYPKDKEQDVVWVEGKIELYKYLQSI